MQYCLACIPALQLLPSHCVCCENYIKCNTVLHVFQPYSYFLHTAYVVKLLQMQYCLACIPALQLLPSHCVCCENYFKCNTVLHVFQPYSNFLHTAYVVKLLQMQYCLACILVKTTSNAIQSCMYSSHTVTSFTLRML